MPLAAGLANKAGLLSLTEQTEWLSTWPAITIFAFALLFEFIGFCIPIFGNFLDVIATPAAVVAGILVMSSQLDTSSPVLNWSLSIIGGGAKGFDEKNVSGPYQYLKKLYSAIRAWHQNRGRGGEQD